MSFSVISVADGIFPLKIGTDFSSRLREGSSGDYMLQKPMDEREVPRFLLQIFSCQP